MAWVILLTECCLQRLEWFCFVDCFNPAQPRTLNIMNSKRYWIETTPLTHDDAKKNCAAHDGWLADIANPTDPVNMELAEIRNFLGGKC